ncbi:MAG: MarC family protein [Bdellovibrionota bacterium]
MQEWIEQSYTISVFGISFGPLLREIYSSGVFLSMGFLSLFTTLNPLGATAFFISHPDIANSKMYRKQTAKKTSIAIFIVLMSFAIGGQLVFRLMGITTSSFQLAGGVFVFLVALDMLRGANVRAKTLPEEREVAMEKDDISIIPLAIPLLAGPGSITVVVLTMSKAQGWYQSISVLLLVASVSYVTYLVLMFSGLFLKMMGESGIRVMNRVMGLFVGAIAVEMIVASVSSIARAMGA